MILFHQISQYGHLDTLNSKFCLLLQILDKGPGGVAAEAGVQLY